MADEYEHMTTELLGTEERSSGIQASGVDKKNARVIDKRKPRPRYARDSRIALFLFLH